MKELVTSGHDSCVGCNRCTRVCPIENANITYQDENGDIKVKVDTARCIACGACISVCKHDARSFYDDTDAFFDDLRAGAEISVIAAPSIRSNFTNWRGILAYLRKLGVKLIYDVSLGADICTWGHLRYIEQYKPNTLITQPCPAVVSYCERHRPELLKFVSPVHSPMLCTAVYMREYRGVTGDIAAISPCIAKSREFEETGLVKYNVTFAKLKKYFENNNIELPDAEDGFDHQDAGLGMLYPTPGGLRESIEFFTQGAIRVDRAEGAPLYKLLDEFLLADEDELPQILDVLNCAEGCNAGPACSGSQGVFRVQATMNRLRRQANTRGIEYYRELYGSFDAEFDLQKFLRGYKPEAQAARDVTEDEIQEAFMQMDKDTYAKQNFDCGACGSETCRDMARKIALKLNLPVNCIVKSRDDITREREKNAELYMSSANNIRLLHSISDTMITSHSGDDAYEETINDAIREFCAGIKADGAYLWRYDTESKRKIPVCKRIFGYAMELTVALGAFADETFAEWYGQFQSGGSIVKTAEDMADYEQKWFLHAGINSVLAVPVLIRGVCWGFIIAVRREPERFVPEDVSIASAGVALIVSRVIEEELRATLVTAREDALSGARAKSDFLARMSHEIRTPMNAIIGMTKIAQSTGDMEKLRHCIATIDSSSSHLLGILNDVLDMAKIESGKLELDEQPMDVEQMLIKISSFMSERMVEKEIHFNILLASNMHMAYFGDELHLSQVVTNLLSNAVKFTPQNGHITIYVEEVAQDGEYSTLRFETVDTGIGIAPEQRARLFTAFEQANAGVAKQYGGTGLGLAISKNIIQLMDGQIWVESELGKGSRFIFEITIRRDRQTVLARRTDEPVRKWRVIICECDPEPLQYLGRLFERPDIYCVIISSLDELRELARASEDTGERFDALFVNVAIPGIMEILPGLADEFGAHRFVIMTPFDVWNKVETQMKEIGITRYITKPMFPSTMRGVLSGERQYAEYANTARTRDVSGLRVLLVEDIDINREVFRLILEGTGVEIDEAENGRIGYERFRDNEDAYDIIVMDMQMPEMDGLESTRAIRAIGTRKSAGIPIIAMTANAFSDDIEKCLAAGMNDHLMKPVDLDSLLEKLEYYANRAHE